MSTGARVAEAVREVEAGGTSVAALFLERAAWHPERVALRVLAADPDAGDEVLCWGEWARASRRFAAALVDAGCAPGTRVAILAGNHPVWPIADLGVLLAGCVSVGVYPTSAPVHVRTVLADSGADVVVVDSEEQRAKVEWVRAELPALRTVICAAGAVGGAVGWDDWLARGEAALGRGAAAELERRVGAAVADDIALLIYTSGSTGMPRGAALSNRYLLASAASIRDALGLVAEDTSLSLLPYAHAAERVFGQATRILCGMEAALVPDATRVWEAARRYEPTLFGGLPRIFEKVAEMLRAEEAAATGVERERWRRTVELGRERSRLRRAGAPVPPALEAEWRRAGAPCFDRLRSCVGGRLRLATSGGAVLPREDAEYLDALGLTVLGAYGLTEHLCVAMNRPDRYDFNSAGPPMPGTEVEIAADGEILLRRGALTFSGYHGEPDATRDAFTEDGEWLRTGDLGALDARGALRVTGRKKELIALSTGRKVAPLPIEARLAEQPLIGEAVLFGEGRKFITALLFLSREQVEAWGDEAELGLPFVQLLDHPALRARVQGAVDRVNEALSGPERIVRYLVLPRDLTQERGELTPTLKLRRAAVVARFQDALDALYHVQEP